MPVKITIDILVAGPPMVCISRERYTDELPQL